MQKSRRIAATIALLLLPCVFLSCGGGEPQVTDAPLLQDLGTSRAAVRVQRIITTETGENTVANCPAGTRLVGGGCECKGYTAVYQSMPLPDKESFRCVCTPLNSDPTGRAAIAHAFCLGSDSAHSPIEIH